MLMPRGGRPLVMASAMPASCSSRAAAFAASVSTLSSVTSVPSTSARRRRMFRCPFTASAPAAELTGRQTRPPSRASSSSAAFGPSLPES